MQMARSTQDIFTRVKRMAKAEDSLKMGIVTQVNGEMGVEQVRVVIIFRTGEDIRVKCITVRHMVSVN